MGAGFDKSWPGWPPISYGGSRKIFAPGDATHWLAKSATCEHCETFLAGLAGLADLEKSFLVLNGRMVSVSYVNPCDGSCDAPVSHASATRKMR